MVMQENMEKETTQGPEEESTEDSTASTENPTGDNEGAEETVENSAD